jgi:hypothetical protein
MNPGAVRKVFREPHQAASLEAMCRRCFIKELASWPADASDDLIKLLQEIPWQVAQNIWKDAANE